jgi:hypothetical protein
MKGTWWLLRALAKRFWEVLKSLGAGLLIAGLLVAVLTSSAFEALGRFFRSGESDGGQKQ